jgi:hypothetical protein
MNIKSTLVAMVMVGAAAALAGCSEAPTATSDSTIDEGAAPQAETSNWYFWRAGFHTPVVARTYGYARFAPPAARVEVAGRAPSANHFWIAGYHRWTGSRYEWVGGKWDVRRPGFNYVPGRWINVGGTYRWQPAAWRRI